MDNSIDLKTILKTVRSSLPGRLRLRLPQLVSIDSDSALLITQWIESHGESIAVSLNPRVGSLLITWDPNRDNPPGNQDIILPAWFCVSGIIRRDYPLGNIHSQKCCHTGGKCHGSASFITHDIGPSNILKRQINSNYTEEKASRNRQIIRPFHRRVTDDCRDCKQHSYKDRYDRPRNFLHGIINPQNHTQGIPCNGCLDRPPAHADHSDNQRDNKLCLLISKALSCDNRRRQSCLRPHIST